MESALELWYLVKILENNFKHKLFYPLLFGHDKKGKLSKQSAFYETNQSC